MKAAIEAKEGTGNGASRRSIRSWLIKITELKVKVNTTAHENYIHICAFAINLISSITVCMDPQSNIRFFSGSITRPPSTEALLLSHGDIDSLQHTNRFLPASWSLWQVSHEMFQLSRKPPQPDNPSPSVAGDTCVRHTSLPYSDWENAACRSHQSDDKLCCSRRHPQCGTPNDKSWKL